MIEQFEETPFINNLLLTTLVMIYIEQFDESVVYHICNFRFVFTNFKKKNDLMILLLITIYDIQLS